MYINFEFSNGGNPYITKTWSEFWKMTSKYYHVQIGNNSFVVVGTREWNGKHTREGYKEILRAFAIEWQHYFGNCNYSYGELAEWQEFFETYGKKYGLLREFRENCFC